MVGGRILFTSVLMVLASCQGTPEKKELSVSGPRGTLVAKFSSGPLKMGEPWLVDFLWSPQQVPADLGWEAPGNFHKVQLSPWLQNSQGAFERRGVFDTYLPGKYQLDPWVIQDVGTLVFPEIPVESSSEGKDELRALDPSQLKVIPGWLWVAGALGIPGGLGVAFLLSRIYKKKPQPPKFPGLTELQNLEALKETLHQAKLEDIKRFYREGRRLWKLWRDLPWIQSGCTSFYAYVSPQTPQSWEEDFNANDKNHRFQGDFNWMNAELDLDRLLHLGRWGKTYV